MVIVSVLLSCSSMFEPIYMRYSRWFGVGCEWKMVRRSCVLCGKLYEQDALRYVSASKQHNAILVTLLMVSSSSDLEQMKTFYDKTVTSKKLICHSHYVDAAKYLAAEMAAVGTRFSYYNDPTAVGSTAYVNEAEIPLHVMDLLNLYMKDVDSAVIITERDICQFMNDALRRYYTQGDWNANCQVDEKMDYEDGLNEAEVSGFAPQSAEGLLGTPEEEPTSACAMFEDGDNKEAVHRSLKGTKTVETVMDAVKQEGQVGTDATSGMLRQPKVECEEVSEGFNGQQTSPILVDVKHENDNMFLKQDIIDTSEVMAIDPDSDPRHDSPGSSAESSSVPVPELDATDPALLKQYFLIEGSMLTKLFKFCPECGAKLAKSRLCPAGTAAVMRYVCSNCSIRTPHVRRWESQRRAVDHKKEKTFKGDFEAAVAAITTGLRYSELQRWAEQLNLSFFTKGFFWKVFQWAKTAVEQVYEAHQKEVMEAVRKSYEENEGLCLAADGNVSKRGQSPLIGKAVLSDTRSKLILHTEFVHRSEIDKIGRVDVEELNRLLYWVYEEKLNLYSLVTARNRALAVPLKNWEPELGSVRHLYDTSQLVKWLETELRRVAQKEGSSSIIPWIEKVTALLWSAVELSPMFSSEVPHHFNACLGHVTDMKEYVPTDFSATNNNCANGHSMAPGIRRLEDDAFRNFREVILNKRFQRDLVKASPAGGVPIRQVENALYRIYCRKDIHYPISVYPVFMKMAEMHLNTLRLAELAGERKVEKVEERDGPHGKTVLTFKTPVVHKWRDSVLEKVLALRARMLSDDLEDMDDKPQEIIDTIEAEDAYDDLA
ncbi:hypothetical protein GCK32_003382 [Trichostrongylus colubriformis]|uniref:Lin-15A/B-like domain-containing protein n=1 Tax=Trichostrongylus colubriformis TaxID=6319 RepID=A0AAN8FHG5_TRICO